MGSAGRRAPCGEEMNAFFLDGELALVRALVLDAVFELLAQLCLGNTAAAQLEWELLGFEERRDLHSQKTICWGCGGEVDAQRGGRELYRRSLGSARGLREARPQRADDGAEQPQRERGSGLLDGRYGEEGQEANGGEQRACGDGGCRSSRRQCEGFSIAPIARHQIEIGGCRDIGLLQEIVQLVDRVGRPRENLSRVELGEDTRPASVGQPDRQGVDGVGGRQVCGNAGNLAAGQEGLDRLEGHELDSSGSTRSGRRRLPVETWRRRDRLGIGGKKDRATRSRGSSGGVHNHGL